jgi:hypothetical protein
MYTESSPSMTYIKPPCQYDSFVYVLEGAFVIISSYQLLVLKNYFLLYLSHYSYIATCTADMLYNLFILTYFKKYWQYFIYNNSN